MVACVMEPGMRNPKTWAGVVGGKLGTSLYVALSHDEGDDGFASGVQRLTKEIQSRFCDSFSFKSVGSSAGSRVGSRRHRRTRPAPTRRE